MLDFLGDLQRTHRCGALRASDSGQSAVLMGWVNRRRDLGNLIFVDVRDRTGITQVVFNKERDPAAHEKASQLRNEYVIAVIGKVKQRTADTFNKNIPTGEVELIARRVAHSQRIEAAPISSRRHGSAQRGNAPQVSLY